ncbi:MAG: response regulator [Deltaproteobacteria bacterium]|nr:response regulator [Deltaproteobacteria bacterium]
MPAEKKTILIVDDEPDVLTYLSTLFEDNGYLTARARDGNEALARVKEKAPDVVTLDITMPNKSGVKFYREMKESAEWKKIPIVIVTGVAGEFKNFISTRRQVPPPEGYLQKPIDAKEILALAKKLAK